MFCGGETTTKGGHPNLYDCDGFSGFNTIKSTRRSESVYDLLELLNGLHARFECAIVDEDGVRQIDYLRVTLARTDLCRSVCEKRTNNSASDPRTRVGVLV